MHYVILRKFLTENQLWLLRQGYFMPQGNSRPLNLFDGDDHTGIRYKSTRNPGTEYLYSNLPRVMSLSEDIMYRLKRTLNVSFAGSINDHCLPYFHYSPGASLKAHRGTQITKDVHAYQKYVAIAHLTQPLVDYGGGKFYVNPHATASLDGKEVFNDKPEERTYLDLDIRDVVIIDNTTLVHGVDKVFSNLHSTGFRLTCSWRSNNSQ